MARSARTWDPDTPVHVIDRGIEGAPLFATDSDRRFLLARARTAFGETGTRCFAFAVMTNHVHFLLQPTRVPLSVPMQRLKTSVGQRFRSVQGERGPAFQGRFRTNVLSARDHGAFAAVAAYILLNPVRAGIVPDLESLESWPWTAYPVLLGRARCDWIDRETLLDAIAPQGGDREAAVRGLLRATLGQREGGQAPARSLR